jgi:hypothetical protein
MGLSIGAYTARLLSSTLSNHLNLGFSLSVIDGYHHKNDYCKMAYLTRSVFVCLFVSLV